MSSARSALESSASRLESVTASAVSLSALTGTSAQKGSPVKLKVASPRPNRWPKHSTTAPKSLHGEDSGAAHCLLENIPEIKQEFDIISKIGEGTFSSVFLASLKEHPEEKFALKHLVPTSSSVRIENELKCLQMMGGKDNVIPIHTCVRHSDHIVLIMPYFPHDRFVDYLPHISVSEVRNYMEALFRALRNVHSHHIIHRDIKPSNFLYNRETKQFQLVDFGLAHLESSRTSSGKQTGHSKPKSRSATANGLSTSSSSKPKTVANGLIAPPTYQRQVHQRMVAKAARPSRSRGSRQVLNGCVDAETEKPSSGLHGEIRVCPLRHRVTEVCDFCMARSHQNAPRAGTPGFRAPEVLLKCPNQTIAVDIWSAGVILLSLLSGRYPFFRAHDDLSAMSQIISLMGSKNCIEAASIYGKELVCVPEVPPTDLRLLCTSLRTGLSTQVPGRDESQPSPSKKSRLCNGDTNANAASPQFKSLLRTRSPRKIGCTTSPKTREGHDCSPCSNPTSWRTVPDSVFLLLHRCLDLNPDTRITAEQALQHPFIADQR